MNSGPQQWLDKLVGLCLSLLVGAVALYVAVQLIISIATALLVILTVAFFVVVGVMVLRLRSRARGW